MNATRFVRPLLLSVLAAGLTGCIVVPQATTAGSRVGDPSFQVPVAVPALNGIIDGARPTVSQSVIVRIGEPAALRLSVDVRRAVAGSFLVVTAAGAELERIAALASPPGEPAIPVVLALPTDGRSELVSVSVRLEPAVQPEPGAVFEISQASVTIGERAPARVRIDP